MQRVTPPTPLLLYATVPGAMLERAARVRRIKRPTKVSWTIASVDVSARTFNP
ncbi:hypothetical protein [Arthrobacter sp. B6]|uniref:hypothetical protein n=1 Tax=Arthrobacter sp. B6 TaxID=1570137 RepID=UPI000A90D0E0|nr:hypothetical protein [Arthrobacter sp. B6]